MNKGLLSGLLLALWLVIIGQVSGHVRLAEELHQLGVDTPLSSTSAEQHRQGHCFTGYLGGLVCPVIAAILAILFAGVAPAITIVDSQPRLQSSIRLPYGIRAPPIRQFFSLF